MKQALKQDSIKERLVETNFDMKSIFLPRHANTSKGNIVTRNNTAAMVKSCGNPVTGNK